MSRYPSVLIFGHSFNNYTGMGITLTNLFANWPKEKIAVWSNDLDIDLCESIRPCYQYIGKERQVIKLNSVKKQRTFKEKCREFLREQYYKIGLSDLVPDFSLDDNLICQAKLFNPEIVFCALGDDIAMKHCEYLMDRLPNSKLVLYIVDDWVNTKINTRYFSSFWRRRYDKDFRHIINRATGLLSICQYMTEEYQRIYGKVFYPFHNPVNVTEWQTMKVEPKYANDIVSILYVGKINDDTTQCLLDMSNVVNELNKCGHSFVFDIYTPNYANKAYLFSGKRDTHVFPAITHSEIPKTIKSYSSVFMPLGFSKQSRSYVRLSMPTKLTEYLASGKPMILYCPEEIALAKYISDKDCAIICTQNNQNRLKEAILKLQNSSTYQHLVENSLHLAEEHDVDKVRERFRRTLLGFIS